MKKKESLENEDLTQLIQDAVLNLCTQHVSFGKVLEIDGIIVVSPGDKNFREVVVKMHRTILKSDKTSHRTVEKQTKSPGKRGRPKKVTASMDNGEDKAAEEHKEHADYQTAATRTKCNKRSQPDGETDKTENATKVPRTEIIDSQIEPEESEADVSKAEDDQIMLGHVENEQTEAVTVEAEDGAEVHVGIGWIEDDPNKTMDEVELNDSIDDSVYTDIVNNANFEYEYGPEELPAGEDPYKRTVEDTVEDDNIGDEHSMENENDEGEAAQQTEDSPKQKQKLDSTPKTKVPSRKSPGSKRKSSGQFQCKECLKYFASSTILKIHMNIHTGKVIQCEHCYKEFADPSNARRHKKKHHPNVWS
ncbi:unnamed protein product [Owenia fusiformis]|uniref:Uncharacterized protein n=1 Tax=Owenia fusiformis TaxID=6347 RepID=A0A8J1XN32_OWEFU|nr:unnamed protein product [Owenia fusiformis]